VAWLVAYCIQQIFRNRCGAIAFSTGGISFLLAAARPEQQIEAAGTAEGSRALRIAAWSCWVVPSKRRAE
jgi:hypothetical protein